jgi:hypothetical protein
MRAALATVLLAAAAPARADTIASFGVGFGPGHALDGAIDDHFDTDGETGGRFLLGRRRGDLTVEASFFGTDLHLPRRAAPGDHSTLSLGIGVKRHVALLPFLELYGRAGLDHTWLVPCCTEPASPPYGLRGFGVDLGAGVELTWWTERRGWCGTGRFDALGASLWIDAGVQHLRLDADDFKPMPGRLGSLTFGASLLVDY